MVEQRDHNPCVGGSNPSSATSKTWGGNVDIPKVFVISPNAFKMRREITGKHLNDVGLNPTFFSGWNPSPIMQHSERTGRGDSSSGRI